MGCAESIESRDAESAQCPVPDALITVTAAVRRQTSPVLRGLEGHKATARSTSGLRRVSAQGCRQATSLWPQFLLQVGLILISTSEGWWEDR